MSAVGCKSPTKVLRDTWDSQQSAPEYGVKRAVKIYGGNNGVEAMDEALDSDSQRMSSPAGQLLDRHQFKELAL